MFDLYHITKLLCKKNALLLTMEICLSFAAFFTTDEGNGLQNGDGLRESDAQEGNGLVFIDL